MFSNANAMLPVYDNLPMTWNLPTVAGIQRATAILAVVALACEGVRVRGCEHPA